MAEDDTSADTTADTDTDTLGIRLGVHLQFAYWTFVVLRVHVWPRVPLMNVLLPVVLVQMTPWAFPSADDWRQHLDVTLLVLLLAALVMHPCCDPRWTCVPDSQVVSLVVQTVVARLVAALEPLPAVAFPGLSALLWLLYALVRLLPHRRHNRHHDHVVPRALDGWVVVLWVLVEGAQVGIDATWGMNAVARRLAYAGTVVVEVVLLGTILAMGGIGHSVNDNDNADDDEDSVGSAQAQYQPAVSLDVKSMDAGALEHHSVRSPPSLFGPEHTMLFPDAPPGALDGAPTGALDGVPAPQAAPRPSDDDDDAYAPV